MIVEDERHTGWHNKKRPVIKTGRFTMAVRAERCLRSRAILPGSVASRREEDVRSIPGDDGRAGYRAVIEQPIEADRDALEVGIVGMNRTDQQARGGNAV